MIIKFSSLYAEIALVCHIVLIVFLFSLTHMAVIKRFKKTEPLLCSACNKILRNGF